MIAFFGASTTLEQKDVMQWWRVIEDTATHVMATGKPLLPFYLCKTTGKNEVILVIRVESW